MPLLFRLSLLAHGSQINTGTTSRPQIAIPEYIFGHSKRNIDVMSGQVKCPPFFTKLRTVVHVHSSRSRSRSRSRSSSRSYKDIVAKYLYLLVAFWCTWLAFWSGHSSYFGELQWSQDQTSLICHLRRFARNFSNIDFFPKSLPLKDDELAMSEM